MISRRENWSSCSLLSASWSRSEESKKIVGSVLAEGITLTQGISGLFLLSDLFHCS